MKIHPPYKKGFTLIELLTVVAIVGIIATIVITSLNNIRVSTQTVKAQQELRTLATVFEVFNLDTNIYPADVGPNVLPVGINQYMAQWPTGPYPGSEYDWDYWDAGTVTEAVQVSIRFCESGTCNFPDEDWASDFTNQSAAYYCISGDCRSWESDLTDAVPGYCFNC